MWIMMDSFDRRENDRVGRLMMKKHDPKNNNLWHGPHHRVYLYRSIKYLKKTSNPRDIIIWRIESGNKRSGARRLFSLEFKFVL